MNAERLLGISAAGCIYSPIRNVSAALRGGWGELCAGSSRTDGGCIGGKCQAWKEEG